MINIPLPDKHVRKAVYTLLNGIVVNGNTINVFDTRITGRSLPAAYILMTTQTNRVEQLNKCGDVWESSILLDIVTRYNASGNTGSRLLADDIAEACRALLVNKLTLANTLVVQNQTLDFPSDLSSVTDNEIVYRKFIRIEMTIN